MKKIIVGIIIGIILAVGLLLILGKINISKDKKAAKLCNFELQNINVYTGSYSSYDKFAIYEGVIKNNSESKELLKAMIVKVYDNNNILVTKGYKEIGD